LPRFLQKINRKGLKATELEFNYIDIEDIVFSDKTCVEGKRLMVCQQEIVDLVLQETKIESVKLDIALPGESTRILSVKDVIEPRVKLDKEGGYFGGVMWPVDNIGSGKTLVLRGASVMMTGPFEDFMEGIVDMSGPGAELVPYSKLRNLILWVKTIPGLDYGLNKEIQKMAGRKVAIYLAEKAKEAPVSEIKTYRWEPVESNLPRIGQVMMLSTRSPNDAYLYGSDIAPIVPTIISPLAAIDGATENVSCRINAHRHTTYQHQNNTVVFDALERHMREFNFAGVIVTLERISHQEKEKNSALAANLAELLRLDGVVVTEENAGNPDADLMMVCRKMEKRGIKTVLITDESAGEGGISQGLADTTPEADAVISTGNANTRILLPPMDKTIGDLSVIGKINGTHSDSLKADGSIWMEFLGIPSSCSELGDGRLSCVTV